MHTAHHQKTLRNDIQLEGVDEMSGCPAYARISPGAPDSGYVLETPNGETFRATLDNATEHTACIMISGERQNVLTVEHVFATLYAYEISNAHIRVWRKSTVSLRILEGLGLANTFSLPLVEGREARLCEQIERAGIVTQEAQQTILTLGEARGDAKLSIVPCGGNALTIEALTDYPVPGEQRFSVELSPQAYRDELAWSRPYGKLIKSRRLVWLGQQAFKLYRFPEFGIGHGIRLENFIWHFSGREAWARKDVARHTCVDRLGAIALLDGRLTGVRITAKGSGHAHDLEILRGMRQHLMMQ